MPVRSILFSVGIQPAACELKRELKHLRKHSSMNFEESLEIKIY